MYKKTDSGTLHPTACSLCIYSIILFLSVLSTNKIPEPVFDLCKLRRQLFLLFLIDCCQEIDQIENDQYCPRDPSDMEGDRVHDPFYKPMEHTE